MAGVKLTAKQAGFVASIQGGATQSDAYRANYNAENMTPKQIWEEASKLAATPKVSQMLFEVQQEMRERAIVTAESITKELEEAREIARSTGQAAAMTGASLGKAKVNGLLIDKVDANTRVHNVTRIELVPKANDNSDS